MARVISWKITSANGDFYAYITGTGSTKEPLIRTEQVTDEDARRIGQNATAPGFDYSAEFTKMKAMLTQVAGYTNLGEASDYDNILSGDEVLMLVGSDGKNIADQTNPFYSFHLSNQSIAIGTGEDYKLDLDAIVEGNAFFERNGVKYGCNGGITVQASSDIQNFFQISSVNGTESSDFRLTIKKGLQFPKNDAHMIEILIVGKRVDDDRTFEAKAVFTIAAVLGGKEGVSYDLIVSPKQFHYTSLTEAMDKGNNDKITVGVLRNGKQLSSQELAEENLRVGYEYDPDGSNGLDVDIQDITYVQLTSEGTYEVYSSTIREHGGSVSFYLISDGKYVDTDSASVVVDGQDGAGVVSIELENEIEAIGVGDDSKIDISGEDGVTAQTNVRAYSGETSLIIDGISLEEASISSENEGKYDFRPIVGEMQDSNGDYYGTIRIILKNGFEFGSDLRDKLKLWIQCRGIQDPKPCNFTLLGVKGGKEGVVYRIEPSDDVIMYDPNANLVKFSGLNEAIPVSELTANHKITVRPKAGMYTKTATEIENDNEYISYSIGQTYSTAEMAIDPTKRINNEVEVSKILGVGEENVDSASRFVTFYWIKKIDTTYYMIDRETVPVISAGINGKFAKIELGNEVDAISIGDDFVLDAEAEVGTTVKVVDGALNELEIIRITASPIDDGDGASGTDDNWPEAKFEISLNDGSQWTDPVQGRGYKLWRFTYTLPNGFDFGENRKEKIKLDARFINEAGEEQELSALFTIVGIPGGKEGQKYQLIPSVDVIRYFTSDEVFDTDRLTCDAALGLERLENAKIYYGTRIRTEEGYRVLDIKALDFENEYALYPVGGVNVRDVYFGRTGKDNWVASSQIAFYLTIDVDGQEMIVDHETVPIISDGKDADPGYKVELSNEIESIATGTDTGLGDLGNNKVTAQTEVYVLRGMEKVEIHGFDYEWIETGSDRLTGVESVKLLARRTEGTNVFSGEISAGNPSRYATLQVVLNKDFDFGAEMRKRLILKLTYVRDIFAESDADKYATVRGLFTLIGVKAGKDGSVYRIVPTPDYVLYDYTSGAWSSPNTITCKALNGSSEMTAGSYEVYYSQNVLYEVGNNAQEVKSKCQKLTGPVGPFTLPSLSDPEPKFFAFYLIVDGLVVDRETVPLVISGKNGKDGKDGVGTVRFDLQNLFEVINTGTDDILDATKTYYTYVTAKYGTDFKAVNAQIKSGNGSGCTVSVGNYDSANNRLPISVTLNNGFNFTAEGKRQIKITASLAEDATVTDELAYTLIRVKNGSDGDSAEGTSYSLLTNAASVVYDGSEWSPSEITAKLFVGSTPAANVSNYGLRYVEGKLDDVDEITGYSRYTELKPNGVFNLSSVQPSENGTIYIAAFGPDNEFLDSEDLPVTVVVPGGGASGIIADLSNERMVVRIGDDDKLDKSVEYLLNTVITIKNGFDPLPISTIGLPGDNGVVSLGNGASIKFSYNNEDIGKESVQIDIDITIQEGGYIDLSNPLSYTLTAGTNFTKDETPMTAEFPLTVQIIGLKGGSDGETVHLQLSHDSIYYDATAPAGYRFTPNEITASLYVNFEDVTNENVWFELVNSNSADSLWLSPKSESEKNVFTFDESKISEFNPITITAWSGVTGNKNSSIQMDSETVKIYRNGRDGEGGFVVDINPKSINIETNENKTLKRDEEFTIKVGLMSGSVLTECDITAETIGNEWFKNEDETEILVNSTPDDDLYYTVTVRLNVDAEFNESGRAGIVFKCHSEAGNQTRVGVFYIYASTGGKGEKGDRGPQTRLRDWSVEHADGNGSGYQAGGENDDYIDIVWHRNKYYLCIKTHDPIASGPAYLNDNEPGLTAREILDKYNVADGIEEGEEPWKEFWEEYKAQPFTASRIATFGEWPKGWVIDEGKIQHTLSAITLDADGIMSVGNPGEVLYEYRNGSEIIYATRDYKISNLFNKYYNDSVPVYTSVKIEGDSVGSHEDVLNVSDYILSGTSTSPVLVKKGKSSGRNVFLTASPTSGKITPTFRLSEPIDNGLMPTMRVEKFVFDVSKQYIDGNFQGTTGTTKQTSIIFGATIDPGEVKNSQKNISQSEGFARVTTGYSSNNSTAETYTALNYMRDQGHSVPLTFSTKSVVLGARVINEKFHTYSLDDVDDAELIRPGDYDIPATGSQPSYAVVTSYTHDTVIEYRFEMIGIDLEEPYGIVRDHEFTYNDGTKRNVVVSANTTFENFKTLTSESTFITRIEGEEGTIVGPNFFYDGEIKEYSSGEGDEQYTLQGRTIIRSLDSNVKVKINATSDGESSSDGKLVFAAGIPSGDKIVAYEYTSGSKKIYEIDNYQENASSFEEGEDILIYLSVDEDTPVPVAGKTKIENGKLLITYNGDVYEYNRKIDASTLKFASSRIYENGRIITKKLHAYDGTFYGNVTAIDGEFNGTIKAKGGEIENVTINNADISGDVNIKNGKSLSVFNTLGRNVITISSSNIDTSTSSKREPLSVISIYDNNLFNDTSTKTQNVTIGEIVVPKNMSIRIPSLNVSVNGFKRVNSAKLTIKYTIGYTTDTILPQTELSKGKTLNTTEKVIGASSDGDRNLKIYASLTYSLKKNPWLGSNSKISVLITPSANATLNGDQPVNKVAIGPNGFIFSDSNNSYVTMVSNGSNTSLSMVYGNVMGFSIDKDSFSFIYGDYSYDVKSMLQWLYNQNGVSRTRR